MAARYWVGNGGNWNSTTHWSTTSGGSSGASIPTGTDNVYFDSKSITSTGQTITANVSAYVNNITFSGLAYATTLAISANFYVYGNITFSSNLTITTGSYSFYIAGGTTQYITCNGISTKLNNGFYIINNSTLVLLDNFYHNTSNKSFTLQGGTLNTNGYSFTTGCLKSVSGYTNAVSFGASTINLYANSSYTSTLDFATGNVSVTCGTSTINCYAGSGYTYKFNGQTYYNVDFKDSPTIITGSNTFHSLTVDASKTLTLTNSTTQTITYDLVLGSSSTVAAATSATIAMNATPVTAKSSSVTFTNVSFTTTVTNRYWIGGTGSESDISHWSIATNWYGGFSVPSSSNAIIFDNGSFTADSQVCTLTANLLCASIDISGCTSWDCTIYPQWYWIAPYGNITTSNSSILIDGSEGGGIYVMGSGTLTATNYTITCPINFGDGGATIELASVLTLDSSLSYCVIDGTYYTLNTNDYAITAYAMQRTDTYSVVLNLGASIITLSNKFDFTSATALSISSGTSKIIMTGVGSIFAGLGLTYYDVEFQNNSVITGSNTYNELIPTAGKTLTITGGTTQHIAIFDTVGTVNSPITITSTNTSTYILDYTGSTYVNVDYYNISYAVGSAANKWYMGANSTGSNDTNIYFAAYSSESYSTTIIEAITSSDTLNNSKVATSILTESNVSADNLTILKFTSCSITEASIIAEHITDIKSNSITLSESTSIQDSITILSGRNTALQEVTTFSDALIGMKTGVTAIVEHLISTDNIGFSESHITSINEEVLGADTITTCKTSLSSISETIISTDTLNIDKISLSSIQEMLITIDSIEHIGPETPHCYITEPIVTSDSAIVGKISALQIVTTLIVSDSIITLKNSDDSILETTATYDTLSNHKTVNTDISESVYSLDEVNGEVLPSSFITEIINSSIYIQTTKYIESSSSLVIHVKEDYVAKKNSFSASSEVLTVHVDLSAYKEYLVKRIMQLSLQERKAVLSVLERNMQMKTSQRQLNISIEEDK